MNPREWTVRWNGKDGYEWDLISPDGQYLGGLWSDGITSPHIQFILDALNEAEGVRERARLLDAALKEAYGD